MHLYAVLVLAPSWSIRDAGRGKFVAPRRPSSSSSTPARRRRVSSNSRAGATAATSIFGMPGAEKDSSKTDWDTVRRTEAAEMKPSGSVWNPNQQAPVADVMPPGEAIVLGREDSSSRSSLGSSASTNACSSSSKRPPVVRRRGQGSATPGSQHFVVDDDG
ncbi:hypothetical protein DCS_07210 [Drechmeria coniospora]|uniref:Uncharacterized protein n=1 Tax=Drechmeria coniospora TaxID=98403 RepID=A0A151GDR9_DRECN|nr:hypothetical protein DCS_07210 [Drechmeria coniospora]KYK55247.1 hypothetical protein DCS_07210 [Drechmeria coniospora]ODA84266.1 hypothetical protein RJ55_02785 [Drechmeria coniospora]